MAILKQWSLLVLFFGNILFAFPIQRHQLDDFYKQVHRQSLEGNFVRFRGRILLSHEAYGMLYKPTQQGRFLYHLVLIRGKVEKFIYLSEFRGVGVGTDQNAYLHFDVRYYETLKDIGKGGDFVAMCVLPRYDKCLLLGYEAF